MRAPLGPSTVTPPQEVPGQTLPSYPPDTSISLNGWVGPVSVPPPTPRRLSVPRWLLVASAAVLLLAASGTLTLVLIRTRGLEERIGAVQAADAGPSFKIDPESPASAVHHVALGGLPEEVEVYLDDTLHLERPLVVPGDEAARTLRILAEGFEPWEQVISVQEDILITPDLIPASDPVHKIRKKKSKKSRGKDRPRIDKSYPGLM